MGKRLVDKASTPPVSVDYVLALSSGFLATLGMTTVIYVLLPLLGWSQVDVPIWVARIMTSTPITVAEVAMGVHFLVGLGYACLFARFVEPKLRASPSTAGLAYGLALWAFAQVVAVPLLGTLAFAAEGTGVASSPGWLAVRLGIGPAIFSLAVHLAYGLILSVVYGYSTETRPTRVWTEQAATSDARRF